MSELMINGNDAFKIWGVRMGDGFLNSLFEPAALKDFIESESRMQNGKRYSVDDVRLSDRELTLSFTIQGKSTAEFYENRQRFLEELYKGKIEVSVPRVSDDVFRLIYTGNSITYQMNTKRTFCQISAKFIEQNPANRGAENKDGI